MNKKFLGGFAVISGVLLLSFELFCLKFFCFLNPFPGDDSGILTALDYLKEPNIMISVFLIIFIIICGLILIITKEKTSE